MPVVPAADLTEQTIATVRRWLAAGATSKPDPAAERLAGVLRDEDGLDFTIGFVDRVVRPEDDRVAARNLDRLSRRTPAFLPWYLRGAISFGGGFAPLVPWPIISVARSGLRRMVGHLIVDATPDKLGAALEKLRGDGDGVRLNLNLLGEAVLGEAEADRRLAGTRALLERDDVDYVSIKVSAVTSQVSMWAFDEMSDRIVARLTPLYEFALASDLPKFINLDMEEYGDLDLTIDVFTRLLDQPHLRRLEAGIVLQAYLPDALSSLELLTDWARGRVARGGAPIKIRIVKGANLAMERVDAVLHDWPVATYDEKVDTDANYKRLLDFALRPENAAVVHVGVAGHNLFDIAHAWLLATSRGVADHIDVEMLLGMASAHADAVRADVGRLILYTPVVQPAEFDSAIGYLVRRLEENASSENFLSGAFDLADDDAVFERERDRYLASVARSAVPPTGPRRRQDRLAPVPADGFVDDFANEPDTDPSLDRNRTWARTVLRAARDSHAGVGTLESAWVADQSRLEEIVAGVTQAGVTWGREDASTRAELLDLVGQSLNAHRGELVEVMISETGKTIAEGDPEVSEAVDFAHYYASLARELDGVSGARYTAPRLTVVAPPWNFPVSIAAGSVLGALAAGSGVILKPAPEAGRTAAVLAEAFWSAGVPRSLLVLVDVDEAALGRDLIAHPAVDRVVLTGSFETAALFRSWRPELELTAETSGKNAIVVTPSADIDLAVADIVRSAFGHAGQKCSAASLVIVVGSVARSERFRRQLIDAVTTLRVGWPDVATTQMGPLIDPPKGPLREALTTLAPGESWVVEPKQLDETGILWSPGVREGVRPGSAFHRTEYFGPVLGIMHAASLEQAIEWQNAVEFGLTAGIHSLDVDEVAEWLDGVQAGNLYVNRGITGAIVRRQPFGGWKRSSVGTGTKAGGPNYVLHQGTWSRIPREPRPSLKLTGVPEMVVRVIEAARPSLSFEDFDHVRASALSDETAWTTEFGISRDVSALELERNVLRYRPYPVTVRLSEGADMVDLVRLVAAAARTRSPISISSAVPVPSSLVQVFREPRPPVRVVAVVVESDEVFLSRAASGALQGADDALDGADDVTLIERAAGGASAASPAEEARVDESAPVTAPDGPASYRGLRVRLIGGDRRALARAVEGSPDVAIYAGDVTEEGRVELLPFVHEQAVSVTAHRFGTPAPDFVDLRI
ncbi:proline dehydrogenase family protein [Frigoribacterium sp. 2-23]|uniref:proline dehydrogenase family protein n=1 Tax=Frigoribacterium sp. 2-23 TaxID=3415006 RepID=UPI003C6F3E94